MSHEKIHCFALTLSSQKCFLSDNIQAISNSYILYKENSFPE